LVTNVAVVNFPRRGLVHIVRASVKNVRLSLGWVWCTVDMEARVDGGNRDDFIIFVIPSPE
jgi:hypothetical protein